MIGQIARSVMTGCPVGWRRRPLAGHPVRMPPLPRTLRRARVALIALAAVLALTACDPATINSPQSTGAPAGNGGNAGDSLAALDGLTVAASQSMTGYSRDRFPHWISQGDGCDTRDVVLKRDGKSVTVGAGCKITGGTWLSPYNNKSYTDPLKLDIDHLVPLAAA